MKIFVIGCAAATLLMAGAAMAGPGGTTCATAEVLTANSTASGDTSAAGYGNNTTSFGAVPSPAADAYYKFTANNVTTDETITFTPAYDGGIALTSTCGNNSTLEQANAGTGSYTVSLKLGSGAQLVNGTTYYIIVTGNPTGSSADVGAFSFTTPTPLPVKLQKFSVQ